QGKRSSGPRTDRRADYFSHCNRGVEGRSSSPQCTRTSPQAEGPSQHGEHVYADVVRRSWLAGRRGSRLIVRPQGEVTRVTQGQDLDSMINAVIRVAREGRHSLQELRNRVRERLLEQPPDHLLVIEEDPGLRQLLQEEIRRGVRWLVKGCSREELRVNPGLAVGALPVVAQYDLCDVAPLLPKTRPAVRVTYSLADHQLRRIRELRESSV